MTALRNRLRQLRRRESRERGSGGDALEVLCLTAAFLGIIAVLVAVGRYQLGTGKIDQAAGAAARAASQQLTAAKALAAATSAARSSLDGAGITCQHVSLDVDTSGFAAQPGDTADVTVTLSCTVSWSDLSLPGWPGTKQITAQASSPLDTKRIGT